MLNFYYNNLPLNNEHLSTMANILGSRGWLLYTGLTVHDCLMIEKMPSYVTNESLQSLELLYERSLIEQCS